jgi:hypothetical protein
MAPAAVAAFAAYAASFLATLEAEHGLDPSGLLAVSLANEAFLLTSTLPFSAAAGVVHTADGGSYDMANATSRQACADGNAVNWACAAAAAVRASSPGVLVAVGVFTPQAVCKPGFIGVVPVAGCADERYPLRPRALAQAAPAAVDFVDVHVYPFGHVVGSSRAAAATAAANWSLDTDLETAEWDAIGRTRAPVLMAETGAFKDFYASAADAAAELSELAHLACLRGFQGVGEWTWDTFEQSGRIWTMLDGGGAIRDALAPRRWADLCEPPPPRRRAAALANGLSDPPLLGDSGSPLSLSGEGWVLRSGDGALEVSATVPGDVVTDLARAGVIADPLLDVNWRDQSGAWARAGGFRYERAFSVAPGSALETAPSALLVLDGVKMAADVFLNGVLLSGAGVVDQHLRYEFEVGALLARGGAANNLTIALPAPGSDARNDEGRFMACSGGWDWSQYSNISTPGGLPFLSFGVWKDVYIVPVSQLSLHALVAQVFYGEGAPGGADTPYPTEPLTDATAGPWTVRVTAHVVAGPAGVPAGGIVTALGEWAPSAPASAPLGALGPNTTTRIAVDLAVPAGTVQLWWPNGVSASRGSKQPLYVVTTAITLPGGAAPAIVDARRVGFRVIAIVTDDDADPAALRNLTGSGGLTTRLRVNGASIWARGSNVIPLDEFAGRADADALTLHVAAAAASGMNLLLIWGGGIFQYEAFYAAADELGLMLYQDLMYSAEGKAAHMCTATETQRREIVHNVRRLGSHPSIAIWASSNELGGGGVLSAFAMATVVGEDTSRPVWPASPSSGWSKGVDRLFSRPTGDELVVRLAAPPADNSTTQTGVYYMGFQGGSSQVTNVSECSALCGSTTGCVVANFAGESCMLRGFGFPVSAWGVTWCEAAWPPGASMPLPLPPLPCKVETHGPYTGGSGWPAINSGDGKTVFPFDANVPPSLPAPGSQGAFGTSAPGLFTSEFGATSFSSFESMSATLSPENWGAHGDALYWRSYSQDNIVASYFGEAAVNMSVVGDAETFARQLLLSQLASALLIKQTVETMRATNNFGLLLWQLGEVFPTGGWGSLEYSGPRGYPGQVLGGRWKPLHNLLAATLFGDVFVACGSAGQCYARNDSPISAVAGFVVLELVSLETGAAAAAATRLPLALAPGPAAVSFFCASDGATSGPCRPWAALLVAAGCKPDASNCFLNASVTDAGGATLALNPSLLAPPSAVLPALRAPALAFAIETPAPPAGSPIHVTVTAAAPALFVTLTTLAQGHFDTNAFFLMPGAGNAATVRFVPLPGSDAASVYAELGATLRVQSL